jgi:predicted nucleic acid-binding protein
MRAVLADAGPLYAAADDGDAHHLQALEELKKLARSRLEVLVAYPTFLEAHSLVLFRMGSHGASLWLEYMADAAFISPTPEDYRQAFAKVRHLSDQRITLFDATVGVLANRLNLPVWTYDHHFDVMRVPVWR